MTVKIVVIFILLCYISNLVYANLLSKLNIIPGCLCISSGKLMNGFEAAVTVAEALNGFRDTVEVTE